MNKYHLFLRMRYIAFVYASVCGSDRNLHKGVPFQITNFTRKTAKPEHKREDVEEIVLQCEGQMNTTYVKESMSFQIGRM